MTAVFILNNEYRGLLVKPCAILGGGLTPQEPRYTPAPPYEFWEERLANSRDFKPLVLNILQTLWVQNLNRVVHDHAF